MTVPTDEAVREVENRLLGVETNITNWQRRQNAIIPKVECIFQTVQVRKTVQSGLFLKYP